MGGKRGEAVRGMFTADLGLESRAFLLCRIHDNVVNGSCLEKENIVTL